MKSVHIQKKTWASDQWVWIRYCAFTTTFILFYYSMCHTMKLVQVHFYFRLWYQFIYHFYIYLFSNTYIHIHIHIIIFGCILPHWVIQVYYTIFRYAFRDAHMYLCREIGCIVTWIRTHNNSLLLFFLSFFSDNCNTRVL